jgi:hydroxymethylbilane synthase
VLIAREARTFEELPQGAVVGTSSIRRARQLRWLRPDLVIEDWRGNVQTRLRKLGENARVAGIILAQAGLARLGYDLSSGVLEFAPWRFRVASLGAHLLPAIGQGAIALQSRADRADVTAILHQIDHVETHTAILAERELQRLLAGDCGLPVGVRTKLRGDRLHMRAILFGPESEPPREAEAEGPAAEPVGIAADLFFKLK